MAVQSFGQTHDGRGFEKSFKAFKSSHEDNTTALLNLAEGLPEDFERPDHDDEHVDNQWPVMLHHATLGELTVGTNMKGIVGDKNRREVLEENHAAKKEAIKKGYRLEPYPKPQVVVLDAAAEKAALLKTNNELQGQITAMQDQINKLMTLVMQNQQPPAATANGK